MARQKSEQVRVAIMGAAERLFMEKGYIATTINSIARAAGTSQSNVYVYYAGHGAPASKDGSAFLVPSDANSQTIEFSGYPLTRV